MHTTEVTLLEKIGNDAVKQLRRNKHAHGLPFMINAQELAANECYLEYPDGKVILVALQTDSDRDFTIIRELSITEASRIRNDFLLR
jgi:hypothetical protein